MCTAALSFQFCIQRYSHHHEGPGSETQLQSPHQLHTCGCEVGPYTLVQGRTIEVYPSVNKLVYYARMLQIYAEVNCSPGELKHLNRGRAEVHFE